MRYEDISASYTILAYGIQNFSIKSLKYVEFGLSSVGHSASIGCQPHEALCNNCFYLVRSSEVDHPQGCP